jgi:hypothetical protein
MNRLEEFLSSDRDKALLDALRQSQEAQKQMAATLDVGSQREKKKWWPILDNVKNFVKVI